ncbi:hypothetical protein QQS21_009633 [Conoideocrella luteorostrata]|uniref:Glycoside hydrolase family 12 protein n=1 Tax=Conoideocrella luteorostrata TaxID=1105319 RepID=A0AAJ0CGM9_9HYPO|nr:hypothetical protein QQS21_009633 [Conoideocrella luteorostrata]
MLRWLVSALFLALPIGTTIGILLGIQAMNKASGRPPPFSGGDDGNGLPGIGPIKGKDVVQMKCDEAYGIESKPKDGLDFTMNANPWGWKKGEPGNICMSVNLNGNRTYATQFSAPIFNATWQYPRATGTGNNVHAFPNAKVESKKLPVPVGSIRKLEFDVSWYLSLKNDSLAEVTETTGGDVDKNHINANVAIDMFLDTDPTKAAESEKAAYEIMVWFADFGTDAWPIGRDKALPDMGVKARQTIGNTQFELYSGQNTVTKQTVLTWKAATTTNKFKGSLTPLLDAIFALNDASYPKKTDQLGYFAFGQEAYSSDANVTFSVPELAVDFETS